MSKNPDLDNAYAVSSQEEIKELYRKWSYSYDTAFSEGQGYQLPREVANAFVSAGGLGPVLDVGAGTGLVGAALRKMNVPVVDGIDLSKDMLDVARMKGDYRGLHVRDVTQTLDLVDAPYAGVVSSGTFTLGHVGPDALVHVFDVAASGALLVISVNALHYVSAGFAAAFADLESRMSQFETRDVRIFDDRAADDHRMDMAKLAIFTKT